MRRDRAEGSAIRWPGLLSTAGGRKAVTMASAEHKSFNAPDETRPFEKDKVVGDDPVVLVDWWGASNYAKS